MDPERREWIKRAIERNARGNDGVIRTTDLVRSFPDASHEELMGIMDEFVNIERVAEVIPDPDDPGYVFKAARKRIVRQETEDYSNLEAQESALEEEMQAREHQIDAIEEVSSIWRTGWERYVREAQDRAIVLTYVSQYWGIEVQRLLTQNAHDAAVLKESKNRRGRLKKKWIESHESS